MIAGGQGQGNDLTQLYGPRGHFVDTSGTLYVADHCHCLAVRSSKVLLQDTVIGSIAPRDCKKRAIVENVCSIQCSSSLLPSPFHPVILHRNRRVLIYIYGTNKKKKLQF